MPTYEFRCPKGHEFERFYKTMSTAPSEVPCPECGAVAARQLSGGGGLLFKGSGFYLTDYGKNAHRGPGPEAKSDGAKAESKGESKSESKSESKAESKVEAKSESKSESTPARAQEPKPKRSESKSPSPSSKKRKSE